MLPVQDTAHVAEAAALLTSRYAKLPVTSGLVKALVTPVQALENKVFAVLNAVQLSSHPLAGGPWDVLDRLGALVGAPPRGGRSDADYLAVIKLQIRVNRSNGLAEDIVQVVALIVAGAGYFEWPPAAAEVVALGTTASVVAALQAYLPQTRSAGTALNIRYSTSTGPYIIWGSSYGGVTGAGFASTYGGAALDQLGGLAST